MPPALSVDPGGGCAESDGVAAPSIEALYRLYASHVARVSSRILGRSAEVEDIVQEVFAIAIRSLRRRDDSRQIKAWLTKVTIRSCVRTLRKRRLWTLVDVVAELGDRLNSSPRASAEQRQQLAEAYRTLGRVPARLRVPWTLYHVEGEQLERVAELCGCSLATVKRRIAGAQAAIEGRRDSWGGASDRAKP